jgi:hypothetical protein
MSALKRQWPWIALSLVLSAYYLTTISRELGGHLGGDNVVYYLLSKALSEGDGYVDLYLPGHPVHHKFPFVLPVLLAPFHLVFQDPLLPMHAMVSLGWAAAAILFGIGTARRLGDRRAGLALGLLAGTLPRLYLQSAHLLSESTYMVFVFAALLAVAGDRKQELRPPSVWRLTLLSLLAFFTRTTGVALGAALGLELWRRRARATVGSRSVPSWLILAAIFGAGVLAWLIFGSAGSEKFVYFNQFLSKDPYQADLGQAGLGDLFIRVKENLIYYLPAVGVFSLSPLTFATQEETLILVLGTLAFLLILVGVGRELRRGHTAAEVFFLLSLLIVLVWPFSEQRFIMPVLPLGVFYLFAGLDTALALAVSEARRRRALLVFYLIVLVLQGALLAGSVRDRFADGLEPKGPVYVTGFGQWRWPVVNWANYDLSYRRGDVREKNIMHQMTNYLIINYVLANVSPENAVVLSRKPMYTFYLSGRESVPIIPNPDPDWQWNYILERQVDYVVSGLDEEALQPMLDEWPERFKLRAMIGDEDAEIFKVLRPGTRAEDNPAEPDKTGKAQRRNQLRIPRWVRQPLAPAGN